MNLLERLLAIPIFYRYLLKGIDSTLLEPELAVLLAPTGLII